jgi:hypothetical protein
MKCSKAKNMLLLAQSAELSDGGRRKLDAHLAVCAGCRSEKADLKRLTAVTHAVYMRAEPSAAVLARIRAEAEAEASPAGILYWRPAFARAVGLAASVSLVVGAWLYCARTPESERVAELHALVTLCSEDAGTPPATPLVSPLPEDAYDGLGSLLLRLEGLNLEDIPLGDLTTEDLTEPEEPDPTDLQSSSTDASSDEICG